MFANCIFDQSAWTYSSLQEHKFAAMLILLVTTAGSIHNSA